MKVHELIDMLRELPEDREILIERYSDYDSPEGLVEIEGVDEGNGWVTLYHPSMAPSRAALKKTYLVLA